MAEVVGAIALKYTIGILSDVFGGFIAGKLRKRGYNLRDIDDIQSKLDALSRRDLSVGISYLNEGVETSENVFWQAFREWKSIYVCRNNGCRSKFKPDNASSTLSDC